jgi:hypothetical protein
MPALNHVPVIDTSKSTTGCCTLIDPKEWDQQTFTFKDKLFAKASVRSFMHMPLNMGSVMTKTQAAIDAANARVDDFLVLSDEVSSWRSDQYFAVGGEVPGLEMAKLSGTYLTKVFNGPFLEAAQWYTQLQDYARSKGKEPKKTYFFYTLCPKCAKAYGKNYVVGFVRVDLS